MVFFGSEMYVASRGVYPTTYFDDQYLTRILKYLFRIISTGNILLQSFFEIENLITSDEEQREISL